MSFQIPTSFAPSSATAVWVPTSKEKNSVIHFNIHPSVRRTALPSSTRRRVEREVRRHANKQRASHQRLGLQTERDEFDGSHADVGVYGIWTSRWRALLVRTS